MSGYIGPIPVPQGIQNKETFTATAGQTTFNTNGYTDGAFINVYLNGVRLINGTDYTATNGSDVVLTQAASVSDVLDFETFNSFSLASQQFENITTKNPTHEDTDGGRESALSFQGEQSGGEISTLAAIQASHDGTADDQKGDLIFKTNDGSDNNAPTERMRIDSNGSILTATLGTDNVHLGEGAGASIASGGDENVVIGKDAGTAITTGDRNTAIGHQAGDAVTTGGRNTLMGYASGSALVDPDRNVAFGYGSLESDTKGTKSTAIGYSALNTQNQTSSTDTHNTAVGYTAGESITTGTSNTLIGSRNGDALTTGVSNVAVGDEALGSETAANRSVAVGVGTLLNQNVGSGSDAYNTAVGHAAGNQITTGTENTFIGALAGDAITDGNTNTGVGFESLTTNTRGDRNVAVGHQALKVFNYTSDADTYNSALGYYAGGAISSGTKNTCLGGLAGQSITTGDYNVMVGYSVDVNTGSVGPSIVIGQSVTGVGSNNFTFGSGSTDSNIAYGATSITAPSDERYKEEITTSTAGLSFINDLRPVTFKWKKEKDVPSDHEAYVEGSDTRVMLSDGETNHGFIAQEVKAAIDAHSEIKDGFRMWSEDYREDADGNKIADNRQRVAPSELIPILTKAIQELSAKNDALETRIAALEAE